MNSDITLLTDQYLVKRENNLRQILDAKYHLEEVAIINGVSYVNDSKSTDVISTMYALSCIEKQVFWIVDSHDLAQEYSVLGDFVQTKVKKIIALGYKAQAILSTFPSVQGVTCSSLEEVLPELIDAVDGDTVLFSPACPTDGRYRDYRHRGARFNELLKLRE